MANQRRQSKHARDFRARRLARAAAKGKTATVAPPSTKAKKGKGKAKLKPAAPAPTATTAKEAKVAAAYPQGSAALPPAPGVPPSVPPSPHTAHAPSHVGYGAHAKDAPHAKNVDAAFDDKSPEHLTPPDSPAKRHWFGHKDDGKKGDKPDKG